MKRQINRVTVDSGSIEESLTFAFISDLHNAPYDDALQAARGVDAILVTGDLLDRHRGGMHHALRFIQEAPDTAPVFFSVGNHETRNEDWPEFRKLLEKSRVTVLDDRFVHFRGVVLGGLTSREVDSHRLEEDQKPEMRRFVSCMASEDGFKLLMCHHPEYYPVVVQGEGIDLTLSGHAHGGQVQLFGHGLYAPGQGILPKYTHGFYDDEHLLVSRGMTNSAHAPRLWNPCEMILLTIKSTQERKG